jgi:hypothetical protein
MASYSQSQSYPELLEFVSFRSQALFAVGVSFKSYTIMIFGRILFGLGGESQGVAQSTLVAIWFGEREIALALGINLSISRLGSVWNDNMSPVMFDYAGMPWQRCLWTTGSIALAF